MTSDVSPERLEDIVELALEAVGGVIGKPPEDLLHAISRRLQQAAVPVKNNHKISFTLLAVYIFAASIYRLTAHAHVRCSFKGKTKSGGTVRTYASALFGRYDHTSSEYLVDFYASAKNSILCPLLTMESEATVEGKDLDFHDFKKLLSVSSPRRIYLFQCAGGQLKSATAKLSSLLDEAYKSQVLMRGDEVVIIAHVREKGGFKFEIYHADQAHRMGHVGSQIAPITR